MLTFETLCGAQYCFVAAALPAKGSSGFGDLGQPKAWPKFMLWICPMSRRALFPTDSCLLWLRRIDHLLDPRQSPALQEPYRQKM